MFKRACSPDTVITLLGLMIAITLNPASAQKRITQREQAWIGSFHQSRMTQRSGLWLDLHFRMTEHFVQQRTMTVARVGYIYYFSDQLRFMGGYAFANRYNQPGVGRIPEHRPWQQLQWIQAKSGFILTQALRIEQRFRKDVTDEDPAHAYIFNWRFRYNMALTIPLRGRTIQHSTPFALVSNEIMVNAGKEIIHNYFDQNRTFLGLGYQFNAKMNAHLGYLFIIQHAGSKGEFIHTHAIRLTGNHNLDFRKRKAEK